MRTGSVEKSTFQLISLVNTTPLAMAAMVPEAAVFQRISDLTKTRWQPPRQEKLQVINTKSHFKKPRFLA